MAIGAAGKILSNTADNVASNVARDMRTIGGAQGKTHRALMGDASYFADDMGKATAQLTDGDAWGGAKTLGKMAFENRIGKDMAGEGWRRTGAVAARNAIPAAAFVAAANVPRYMSGGTPTTNNQGQRDIAGIPFM